MFARTERKKARLLDLVTTVLELVRDGKRDPERVSAVLQGIKDNRNFAEAPAKTQGKTRGMPSSVLKAFLDWQTLYRQEFGIEITLCRIPKRVPGLDRLIVVAQGLTPNQIVSVLKKQMTVWQYVDNLDTVKSDRKTDQTYAIWVRDRVEADEELKNKSANDLAKEQINCITLEERLLYHLKYFLETGKHLDEKNVTLCAGSRDPDGGVPDVGWDPVDRKLGVSWYDPGGAGSNLRGRAAVC